MLGASSELSFAYDNGSGAAWDDDATYHDMTIDKVSITQID